VPWSADIPMASLSSSAAAGLLWLLLPLALVAAPWVAVRAYRDTQPRVQGPVRLMLMGLRVLVLWALLALLAEPVLFRSRTVHMNPSVLLLVDDSASMSVASVGGQTRFERALEQRGQAAQLLREFNGDTPVWFGEGSRRLARSGGPGSAATGSATGEGTDLRALLVSATQRHLEDELAAILLFSDGMATEDGLKVSLTGLNVPVWAVAAPDSAGPTDLGLRRVRYPSRVSRGDQLALEGEVQARAPAAGSTVLRLRQGGVVIDSLSVDWMAGTSRHDFRFVVRTDSVGYARYALEIAAAADEKVLRNNEQQIGVRVEKDRLRVLQLASTPDWDTHFLRHAVSADRRIQWDVVYRTPAGLRVAGTDSLLAWPLAADELDAIDLFVTGGSGGLSMVGGQRSGVLAAVREGAGLWIQLASATTSPVWPRSIREIAPIVPGTGARWVYAESRVSLPAQARSHPVWAISSSAVDIDESLSRIPPLQARVAPVLLASDADLLLRASSARVNTPVLAVRREGRGRVAVFNGAPLWSWSFWRLYDEGNQAVFGEMVSNLVTWMAEGGDRQRLRLTVPRPVVSRGELSTLRALALDARLRPDTRHDVWLEWARADGSGEVVGRLRMDPDAATPGGRIADLGALPAGEYQLRCRLEDEAGSLETDWQPLTVDPFSVEFRDPRVDRPRLAALARATGGALIDDDDFEAWAQGLNLSRREVVLTGRVDLGAGFWLLVPLLVLLSLEWALRKRVGLI